MCLPVARKSTVPGTAPSCAWLRAVRASVSKDSPQRTLAEIGGWDEPVHEMTAGVRLVARGLDGVFHHVQGGGQLRREKREMRRKSRSASAVVHDDA